jgi:hypothetical protein
MERERSTTVSQLEGLIAQFKNSQYSDSQIVDQMFSVCLILKTSFPTSSFSFGTEFTPTKQIAPFKFGANQDSSDESISLSDSESEEDRVPPKKKPVAKKRPAAFGSGGGSEESDSEDEDSEEEVTPAPKTLLKKKKKAVSDSESDSDSEEGTKRTPKRLLKKKKDPNAPKRPMSAYLLFCLAKRGAYREAHPEARIIEVSKALAEMWKGLPDSAKAIYQEQAAQAKVRYEEEMRQYQAKQEEDAPVAKSKAPQPKIKKEETASPAKKPLSAYMFFAREKREEVKAKHPEMGFGDLTKEMAVMWKEMNETDKQVWTDKAQADMDRYKKELNN